MATKKNAGDTPVSAPHTVTLRGLKRRAEPKTPVLSGDVQLVGAPRRIEIAPDQRDAGETVLLDVPGDEVVRVEYDEGLYVWTRVDDLLRERGRRPAAATRGDGALAWEIDPAVQPIGAGDGTGAERGAAKLVIKALEFFGVQVTAGAAGMIGTKFERHRLGREPGLYRVALEPGANGEPVLSALASLPDPGADQPVLVFLHGTMSSLGGSFKGCWAAGTDAAGAAAKALRTALAALYGDRIYAFEHRTLSESPIANALALAQLLPAGVPLHLVSHSRGGLVGELLCLGQREKRDDPIRAATLETLFKRDTDAAPQFGLAALGAQAAKDCEAAYAQDRQALIDLVKLLDDKRIVVRRFVRVAAPARGTTLASGRLDRWLSTLNLIVPAGPGGLFGDAADFLLAVVKERTDPRTLPGLEAMMPGSALTLLLNHPDLKTDADLSVIAGDIEGGKLLGRLKVLVADWFYGSEHDLVVNTGSMYGGITRQPGRARFQRAQGPEVDHFRYFSNRASIEWLMRALQRAEGADAGFLPIAQARHEAPASRAAIQRGNEDPRPRPIAIVVPGTMGSELSVDDKAVWLSYRRLMLGALGEIAIDAPGEVRPSGLLEDFYGPLLRHLAQTHRVHIVPYDWRRSVRAAAARLTAMLVEVLPEAEKNHQPVHIVAHSMGGLVARAMIADTSGGGADVWARVRQLPGSRLLMLGTPNLGSHEAVRWLVGQNPTQAKLILLDMTRGANGVIDVIRRFPGVAELLPFDDASAAFARPATWRDLKADLGGGWGLVDDAALTEAATTWKLMRETPPEPAHMVYVAGCHPATVIGYRIEDEEFGFARKVLRWRATEEGDGTVSWKSGELRGVPTYYAPDTGHDELCSNDADASIFRGYVDLLRTGATDQLKTTPPGRTRSAERVEFDLPPLPVLDDLPDEAALRSLGFGGTRPRVRRGKAGALFAPIEVSVRHGNLAYARHPVLVGHYSGDTIVSAERALDRQMRGTDPVGPLSRRRDLGLYPGPAGTHAVFFNADPGRKPVGALVVGLGQVGELSPSRLETGVRDVLIEYALRMLQRQQLERHLAGGDRAPAGEPIAAAARVTASVSSILVGTGASSLTPRESIEALLRGTVAANAKLQEAGLDSQVLIDRLEFIELYEDLAIGAGCELATLLEGSDFRNRVTWTAGVVQTGHGGQQRSRFDFDSAWWQRIEITEDRKAERLRFVATTDRARAEESMAFGDLRAADAYIADASGSAIANADVSKTLFEMLLPQRFKEAAPDQRPLVLLVDEYSARFPWELLEDRWSRNGRPPAVTAGMVRQFKTSEFRADPAHSAENSIYIVGNPDLQGWDRFGDLPAARAEAELVNLLFGAHGFERRTAIGATARDIRDGLHARAWRVLHLAGHGEHEFEVVEPLDPDDPRAQLIELRDGAQAKRLPRRRKVSGMVIGNQAFLTAGDVQQMRYVPELVFVNCCHLGKTLDSAPAAHGYNRLAANLGVEFIRMGVRAVVCAGWAVGDEAAKVFAGTFYRRLLAGDDFGAAVHLARQETWELHRDVNTWGAFHCYGDPGYRLIRDRPDGKPAARAPFVASSELCTELGNLTEWSRMQGREPGLDPARLTRSIGDAIRDLCARIPVSASDWRDRADVCAALGFAYGEAALFDEAVEWLDKAIRAARGACPVRVAEQRTNLQVRSLWVRWLALPGATRERERDRTAAAIRAAMVQLAALCDYAPTGERRTLLGSASKRLAAVARDAERIEALQDMAAFYGAAFDLDNGDRSAYAFNNAAIAMLLLGRLDPARSGMVPAALLEEMCHEQAALARAANEREPELWQATGLADLDIVLMLLADGAAGDTLATRAQQQYDAALARGASPRERASIGEHLDFLIEMCADRNARPPWSRDVRDGLAQIRQALP